uniref:Uncharacterized protein n=1 Tax=Haptolina ericina TaxID=156174 RepID=A0A7S3AI60_9EUKA
MAKYKDFFLNLMMTEELQLPLPDEGDHVESLKDGIVSFLSFATFGLLPVAAFGGFPAVFPSLGEFDLFLCSCALTCVALFFLGAYKAHFSDKRYLHSAAETVLLGAVSAGVAFFLGRTVEGLVRDFSETFQDRWQD